MERLFFCPLVAEAADSEFVFVWKINECIASMAVTLATTTPKTLTAGDTWEWTIALADYPSPAWTLTYYLVKSGTRIELTGAQYAATDDHHVDVAKTVTQGYTTGSYSYQAVVDDGTDRKVVETGTITVLTDFQQQTTGYDDRSFARKSLEAIEAVIEGRASQAHQEYQIAGRALKFMTLDELLNARDRFQTEVREEERRKAGKPAFGAVKVRFG